MPTSINSGLWNDPLIWNTGAVPVDNEIVIIALGHDVEFNVDMTLFPNGVDLTITGTLHASTTPGSYVLKMSSHIDGAGTLRAGTSVTAYPQNCTFEIMRRGFQISAGSMTLDLNCTEPTYKFIRITGAEGIGSTVLEVDTSVLGDIWKDGDIVRIDDIDRGNDSEERVIAAGGVAAGAITITAGLTNAKIAGALVILITRNVRITHTSTAGYAIAGGTAGRIGCQIFNADAGVFSGNLHVIFGTISRTATYGHIYNVNNAVVNGVFTGGVYGISNAGGCTLNGLMSGLQYATNSASNFFVSPTGIISGCLYGAYYGTSVYIAGLVQGCNIGAQGIPVLSMKGTINNCLHGVALCGGQISGTISNCGYGLNSFTGNLLGATFFGNTTCDIVSPSSIRGFNASLNSATQAIYSSATPFGWPQVAIWNIGGVASAFKAWMRGGRVQSQAGVVPAGRTVAYQHICESASFPVFMDRFAEVEPGETVTVNVWLRKDALMAYLPRCQVFRQENDPLLGGAVLTSVTMTDSLNTWEAYTLTWQNTTVGPVSVVVRTLAMNAANNLYADTEIINGGEVSGGSPFAGVFG